MTDLEATRAGRRLLLLHTAAVIVAGMSLGLAAVGRLGLAIAIVFVVLIALIASLETLRVLVLSDRSPRR